MLQFHDTCLLDRFLIIIWYCNINGTIDVTSLTGRALLGAGKAITVGGTIVSKGGIDVHSGINMAWSRADMEASNITRADLSGGSITISGQASRYIEPIGRQAATIAAKLAAPDRSKLDLKAL
mgnify:CR=1 FL=1